MYSPSIVSANYEERRNIVVSVNRCFDTIVDNDFVSDKSQHGRVMNEMYTKGLYTPDSLNEMAMISGLINSVPRSLLQS